MTLNTRVVIKNTEGNVTNDHIKTEIQASYEYFTKLEMPLSASVLTTVDIPFTTALYAYLEVQTDGATVRFYKNAEATYDEVTSQLLLNGTSLTEIVLFSDIDADIFLYMGGN